jgi:hypothetical protein
VIGRGVGRSCSIICWGERIRTSDWLIQNQLPYRLATPQEWMGPFEVYRTRLELAAFFFHQIGQ